MTLQTLAIFELTPEWIEDKGLAQAILYHWDHIETHVQNSPSPCEMNLDRLLEGFWFGERAGLHLYREDGDWLAVFCEDGDDDSTVEERQLIRRKSFGSVLHVRHYLDFDEDGQAFVAYSRPVRVEP